MIFIHNPKTGGTSIIKSLKIKNQTHTPRFMVDTDKFTFGFVRNPYDWIGSFYEYTQMHKWHYSHGMGFKQFVRDYVNRVENEKFDTGQFYYCTQSVWVDGCDFIGRFEHMDNDWGMILDKLGKPYKKLPHLNKSKALKNYSYLYDSSTIKAINKTFHNDFVNFGYDKRR